MRLILIVMMALVTLFSIGSMAALPADFDSAQWEALTQKIVQDGERMDFQEGEIRTLSHLVPEDTTKPRRAEYISTLGFASPDGTKYGIYAVSTVSEDWKLRADGNWEIHQLGYVATYDGHLERVMDGILVITQEGRVLETIDHPVGSPESEKELTRWSAELKRWIERVL